MGNRKTTWHYQTDTLNIKKITRNVKHKLGEGGYGYVYRGTLRSGNEVAIKILKQSKAHGQDFIDEVATIGRIHHVNIVQLIGFFLKDSKQALVYDFMSNGSLDKHIFTKERDKFLDYKKIYEIALGVARGIEYLHRGCDRQILHFDINFEMLLMEMASRRKNWVYDHVNEGESVEMDEVVEKEREVIKNMIIIALWCIQLSPNHRPPMNNVLEMLEGDIGNIQMPQKPLIYPSDESVDDDRVEMELETFSTSSSAPIISASFPF
ncbi:hypothetical protein EUGRSUZ_K00016 [Eucalyptus grandis]|uniref:Uncharacterized protein n=1 Tax=Eucalyptus grandis TaxID=71139 RepID=A0ACC3IR13_EUCGR|nr:hypothetical protein EUGRSUZ_K00016 [Eucalyptus grandis]